MNLIIFDSSHALYNKEWREFYLRQGIKWISISSYSLQLNSAEKIIGVIKRRLIDEWLITGC